MEIEEEENQCCSNECKLIEKYFCIIQNQYLVHSLKFRDKKIKKPWKLTEITKPTGAHFDVRDQHHKWLTTSFSFLPLQYLTKQNTALKEVNDSRLHIYENLDVSIRDLEIEKHGLMVQTSNDKKFIKK